MKTLTTILGALVSVGGILLFIVAFLTPFRVSLVGASESQITRVYTQATLFGVLSVAAFVFAGVLLLAASGRERY